MKVIRHRPERRREWSDVLPRRPRKRALLIGIQYEQEAEDGNRDANALKGPHSDVSAMRDTLLELYSYAVDDIVILIDSDDPGQKQPTRVNILGEIKRMVEDARSGDNFFFHYAGHAAQIENRNFTEEDGLDECIIPCDGESNLIMDNELRRLLVDSLPIGSNLVAIFDSCHSASLLDLHHFRCNRVYVPWLSKGKRKSDTQWNWNVRRRAFGATTTSPVALSPQQTTHHMSSPLSRNPTDPHISVLSRRVFQTSLLNANTRHTSRDEIIVSASVERQRLTIRTRSLSPEDRWLDAPHSPILRCSSPESVWPCTGDCPPSSPHEANVIAIAACKDYQLSWEDFDGASMTRALIHILRETPHPSLGDLMTRISHELHKFYVRLHDVSRDYRRKVRLYNKRRIKRGLAPKVLSHPPEMDNFQDPQLSSHVPIARETLWNP